MMRKAGIYVVTFYFFLTSAFFSFQYLDTQSFSKWSRVLVSMLFAYVLLNWKQIRSKSRRYKSYYYMVYFVLAPFLTHISCLVSNNQSITSSISVSATTCVLTVYFICILFDVRKKDIVRLIIFLAIARTALTFVEQFTYPNVPFAFRMDQYDEYGIYRPVEVRSGYYRFMISDAYYLPVFAGFYGLNRFLQTYKLKFLLLFLIASFGIYMDQGRQIMFIYVLCLTLMPFLLSQKRKMKYFTIGILVLTLVFMLLYVNFETLFGEMASKTEDEMNYSNIRYTSYTYYITHTGGVISSLLGNGFAGTSDYGNEIRRLQEIGLWRVDIGIVGAIHLMGYVFVVVFLSH